MENNDKNTENDTTGKNAVMQSKKLRLQELIQKNPKCKICNTLTHEWLDGDYTSLICDSSICLIR
jgi:hypothetical protein